MIIRIPHGVPEMKVKNDIWLKNLVFASLRRLPNEKIREPQNFDICKRQIAPYVEQREKGTGGQVRDWLPVIYTNISQHRAM